MGALLLLTFTTQTMAEDLDSLYATSLLKAGTQAPAFTLPTPEGKSVSLETFKGKYVVIDFWASWCPDCRRIASKMEELAEKYHDKGVAFVGVSFDTDKDAWTQYINRNGAPVHQTHVSELKKMRETQVAKDYGLNWIPSLYLIDKEGKVMLSTVEVSKLERALDALFQ